ncbi:MAG: beta-ketoacyl-[acyl-carrier-protein] synthase family protein [Desulfobacterales bacterium]|nr:beta-ketoacyl-[acyl-carrier-protein] synthase family protein [Desulfobacterales bacterium]
MKAAKNRRVFIVDYGAATPLGNTFEKTWEHALKAEAGFRKITRCEVRSRSNVVGEIPEWDPGSLDFVNRKEAHVWDADYVFLTMAVCKEALERSGLIIDEETGPKTACLVGSALNGTDSFRIAMDNYSSKGPAKVSPYLLPNLCSNLPAGKAGILMGFTGPIFSPQGACASGNYAIGIGARMIRDGDCDFVLAGGVDTCLMPEIVQGFANMLATIKVGPKDRAYKDPTQASRPFSIDRKGIVLSEGGGVLLLAAEEMLMNYGLTPKAEVMGIGWTSDAYHFTLPNPGTIIRAIREAIDDAGLDSLDINYVNTHGTSTKKGDKTEIECLRTVFGKKLEKIPISSNKSQVGHTLGASAAIEAALSIEAMQKGLILPTINHIPDPEFSDVDVVPNEVRKQKYEIFLSNSFGFGGTNCCVVFRGV